MTTNAIQAMNAGNVDPYLLATLQTYNPNFKGSQYVTEADATRVAQVPQLPATTTGTSVANLPQADYSEAPDSSTGAVLGLGAIAIGASALIVDELACKGKYRKKLWDKLTGMFSKGADDASKKIANKTTEKLEGIRVKMVNGKPVYNIAGKTTTETNQAAIQGILDKDKKLARQLQSIRYGTGETKITAGTFTLKDNGITNYIEFEGDKIKRIWTDSGNITDKFVENGKLKTNLEGVDDTSFVARIEDYVSKIKSCDKDVVRGKDTALRDITYTTTIGDASATCTREYLNRSEAVAKALDLTEEQLKAQAKTIGKDELLKHGNPTVTKLTTLKDYSADSDEVLAYVRRSRENGVNIDSIVAEGFVKKGKLPEGYKVQEFTLPNKGTPIKVVDGKIEGITINGKYYGKDTDKCRAYLERDNHAKAIEKMIEKALKDNNIPKGATIIPA